MTHLVKLTLAILVVLTPMTASADPVLTQTDPPIRLAVRVMEPPVMIEIQIPGPPPVREIQTHGIAVGR